MSRSKEFGMSRQFREIILILMRNEGRNFDVCELCGGPTEGKPDIHHEKYEGAKYEDLKIACKKCNHAPKNVGLS